MSKLLIDDYPLMVLPKLAKEIGLNEAIFVQQLHYWTNGKSGKTKDGRSWVYNTYHDWQEQFPFWSLSTVRRTITSCEEQEVVIAGNYNKLGIDNTKWYAVNYEVIKGMSRPSVQNEQTTSSEWAGVPVQNEQTITRDYSKTTTDTKTSVEKLDNSFHKEVIDYLNEQTGSNYRHTTKGTQRFINGRISDGYKLEDFKYVIDVKVKEWGNNSTMKQYLRPKALFSPTNFENYMNQDIEDVVVENNKIDTGALLDSFGSSFK